MRPFRPREQKAGRRIGGLFEKTVKKGKGGGEKGISATENVRTGIRVLWNRLGRLKNGGKGEAASVGNYTKRHRTEKKKKRTQTLRLFAPPTTIAERRRRACRQNRFWQGVGKGGGPPVTTDYGQVSRESIDRWKIGSNYQKKKKERKEMGSSKPEVAQARRNLSKTSEGQS